MSRRSVLLYLILLPPVIMTASLPGNVVGEATGPPLLLNEICPRTMDGGFWVELHNPDRNPLQIAGLGIRFFAGGAIGLPAGTPPCPAGGMVLLRIGNSEAEPFVKDRTVYIDIRKSFDLNPTGDGALLIMDGEQVDAISWGKARRMSSLLLPVGPPLSPPVEGLENAEELFRPGNVCVRKVGSWPPSSETWVGSRHWSYMSAADSSPGAINKAPGPKFMHPVDGARLASRFRLSVAGLEGEVTFQIAGDDRFGSPVVEESVKGNSMEVTGLPPGEYFWRVRAGGPWSKVQRFSILALDLEKMVREAERRTREAGRGGPPRPESTTGGVLLEHYLVNLPHLLQRKDTTMVCLDGCPEHGDYAWDQPHPGSPEMSGGHKEIYCARACLSMIASQNGCTLSQDRIAYYLFEEAGRASRVARESGQIGNPLGDLGHGRTVYLGDARLGLEWIYRQPAGSTSSARMSSEIIDDLDASDMDSVRDFLADDRPVLRTTAGTPLGHSTVIDGYALVRYPDPDGGVALEERFIRVLDPFVSNDVRWMSTLVAADDTAITFPPASGRPARCDEPELGRDRDSDFLNDFDEIHRLHTDPNNADSDDDRLRDDDDMRGYLFTREGTYNLRERDIDGDGAPKELDPDNDRRNNDGVTDGCEDANHSGFLDPGGRETDNFDGEDDGNVMNPRCTAGFMRLEGSVSMGGFPGGEVVVREELAIEQGHSWDSDEFAHTHTWEMSGGGFSMAIPGRGNITAGSEGSGTGWALVTIKIEPDGRYRIVTDVQPRQGTYRVTASGGGIPSRSSTHPLFFGFGDHHYDYVSPDTPHEVVQALHDSGYPNIFEGQVESPPGGGRVIRGEDRLTLPRSLTGNLDGGTHRTWEIWIELPPEE